MTVTKTEPTAFELLADELRRSCGFTLQQVDGLRRALVGDHLQVQAVVAAAPAAAVAGEGAHGAER